MVVWYLSSEAETTGISVEVVGIRGAVVGVVGRGNDVVEELKETGFVSCGSENINT